MAYRISACSLQQLQRVAARNSSPIERIWVRRNFTKLQPCTLGRGSSMSFLSSRFFQSSITLSAKEKGGKQAKKGAEEQNEEVKDNKKEIEEQAAKAKKRVVEKEIQFNSDNVGSCYVLHKDHVGHTLPEGFSGHLDKDFELFKAEKALLLIRSSLAEITEKLRASSNANFVTANGASPYLLLDGPPGSGKSTTLGQTVYWARKNGWIVAYIPDARKWMSGSYIEESKRQPGVYDQPEVAQEFCTKLHQAHDAQLKQIQLKTTFQVGNFHGKPSLTLADLVNYGATTINTQYSTDVVYHIRRELSLVTEFPVLIAIDGLNVLYGDSKFGDPKSDKLHRPRLPGSRLTLTRAFMNFANHGLANGTTISAVTSSAVPAGEISAQVAEVPEGALVHIPKYSAEEFNTLLKFYEVEQYIFTQLPDSTKNQLFYLTAGLGRDVVNYCKTL